jgi:hypothetical protein
MVQVITNLLTLNALNTPPEVYWALAAAWVLIVTAGITSIASQHFSTITKIIWLLVIIAIPVAGMLLYCAYCILSAEYAIIRMLGLHKHTSNQLKSIAPKN